jgi:hypothetical protein
MSRLTQSRWLRRFGFGAVAALSLLALAPSQQAQAHEYGYRAPVVHHAAFIPRLFFGFGGHHGYYWGHHWR